MFAFFNVEFISMEETSEPCVNLNGQAIEEEIGRDIANEENDFIQRFVVGEINIAPESGSGPRLKRKSLTDGNYI